MLDRIKKHRFIIDYVLTADNCKPHWVKKHRVDEMTYSMAGSVNAGLEFDQKEIKLAKIKSNKTCSQGFSRAARPKFEAFRGLPGR